MIKIISESFNIESEFEKITFKKLKPYLIEKDVIFEEIFEDNSTKFFLNLIEINDENISLNEGDEIAFLPPVTGG